MTPRPLALITGASAGIDERPIEVLINNAGYAVAGLGEIVSVAPLAGIVPGIHLLRIP